jgi:hypothetical protein
LPYVIIYGKKGGREMSIVKYKNQSGVTYAYEQTSVYDPEKKQSRPKRKYLGRVDPETGEIISTEGRKGRPPKAKNAVDEPLDGKGFRALYEAALEELSKSRLKAETLMQENKKLADQVRHLSSLLISIQDQIREAFPKD